MALLCLVFAAPAALFTLTTSAAAETGVELPRRVIMAGVSGLTWDDITAEQTPTLWSLVEDGASGAELIRGVYQRACVADAWLTLGTGQRTAAPRRLDARGIRACPQVRQPTPVGSAWQVPAWDELPEANENRYDPTYGLMADSLSAAGECGTAVGPGAALMLADENGLVSQYLPFTSLVDRQLLRECAVTAIDLGELPPRPEVRMRSQDGSGGEPFDGTRSEALSALDQELASLLQQLPDGATFILTSTGDETPVARLRVLMALGPGPGDVVYANGRLTTTSTRRAGLVQITDVTPMVLETVSVPPIGPVVGTAPTVIRWDLATEDRVLAHQREDQLAQAILRITFPMNQALLVSMALLYGGMGIVAFRLRRRSPPGSWTAPTWMSTVLRTGSLLLASVPISTYLVNLIPWWHLADGPATGRATAVMLGLTALFAIAMTAASLFPRRWRTPYRPVAFVATATVLVMAADVVTGSRLQIGSVLGLSPIVGGRFFGFGNVAFAIFATGSVFAIVSVVAGLVRRGRRRAAASTVLALGLVAAVIDGWPTFGADFGGMLAIMMGMATFGILIAGNTIRARWLVLVGIAAVLFTAAISTADWLRPASQRTHLGDFVETVLVGDGLAVVRRKLLASLESFTYLPLAPVVPVLLVVLFLIVMRPERMRAARLREAYAFTPSLQAGLVSLTVIAVVGTFVNDSGIIVPGTMLGFAIPLGVAAAAFDRRTAPQAAAPDQPEAPVSR